jgi:hypothetical protein
LISYARFGKEKEREREMTDGRFARSDMDHVGCEGREMTTGGEWLATIKRCGKVARLKYDGSLVQKVSHRPEFEM